MSLSLAVKKNVRDNEAAIQAAAKKLEMFSGGPITVDVDYAAVNEVLAKLKGYNDRPGEIVKWIIEGLAGKWDYMFKNDQDFKDTLAKAWTTKKLIVKPNSYKRPSGGEYHNVTLEEGSLVVNCDPELIASNVADIGKSAQTSLGLKTEAGYSLKLAKNVVDYKKKIDEKEKAIATATGVSGVSFKVDFLKIDAWIRALPNNGGKGYEDRAAEVAFWVIDNLGNNLIKLAKDDLVKEALQEGWKGEIHMGEPNAKLANYHETQFKDGQLWVFSRSPMTNVSDIGKDIEKRL